MAVRLAQAGSNEWHGTHGGEPGNQRRTGVTKSRPAGNLDGELNITNWYSMPWVYVIRAKDPAKREKIADTAYACVANPKIGYDQNDRQTLYNQMRQTNWDASKVNPCETDCSSMWCVCANAAGVSIDPVCWTGILKDQAEQSGAFDILTESKYLTSGDYLLRGDAVLRPNSHVAIAIDNGPKAEDEKIVYNSAYKSTADVYIRTGPGMNYSTVAVVPKDSIVYVGGIVNDWLQVQYLTYTGYSYMGYYEKVEQDNENLAPISMVATANVWLRSDAGTNNLALVVIPKDTKLRSSGRTKMVGTTPWYQVSYDGYIGYTCGAYFNILSDDVKFKTTGQVNMRALPSIDGKVVGVVPAGKTVKSDGTFVEDGSRKWCYCRYGNKSGYVSDKYLEEVK